MQALPAPLAFPASTQLALPTLIAQAGDQAARRFIEFFTAHIRNPNTRRAYARAAGELLSWAEAHGLTLASLQPVHVAAYVEELGQGASVATVKQRLAAIRALFDFFVVGQVIPMNPAASVRGPKLSRQTGTTPALLPEEARALLNQPDIETLAGLRDRAIVALMLYSFARVSAVLGLRLADYYPEGKRWYVRLREKRGKERTLPVHHDAEAAIDAWIEAAGITAEKNAPLFRALTRAGDVLDGAPSRQTVTGMIKRHAEAAGIETPGLGSHAMRATGITTFLSNEGALTTAQEIAGHADVKTTRLYDRRGSRASISEIERVRF